MVPETAPGIGARPPAVACESHFTLALLWFRKNIVTSSGCEPVFLSGVYGFAESTFCAGLFDP
jgi:hypothetical protein